MRIPTHPDFCRAGDGARYRVPKNDFQVGDRIRHRPGSYYTPYKGLGTVVATNTGSNCGRFRGLVEIEWDTNRTKRTNQGWRTISLVSRAALNHGQPYFSYLGKYYSAAVQQSLNNLHSGLVGRREPIIADCAAPVPVSPTSLQFHLNPHLRKWDTSYTKGVLDELDVLERLTPWTAQKQSIIKARNLLRGYWTDLHIPYEQRDAARAELEKARLENASLREIIASARRVLERKA
jgi:hypothetical protein